MSDKREEEVAPGFNAKGLPWRATERDVSLTWCRRPVGEAFRCAWCGHRFEVGDLVRCVFTNTSEPETEGISGNPFICDGCHGPRDVILAKLRVMRAEARDRYWWFLSRLQGD